MKIAPWITNGLVKSVTIKNNVVRKLRNDPNNIELKNEYKKYHNK